MISSKWGVYLVYQFSFFYTRCSLVKVNPRFLITVYYLNRPIQVTNKYLSSGSTTVVLSFGSPILQVPTGWWNVKRMLFAQHVKYWSSFSKYFSQPGTRVSNGFAPNSRRKGEFSIFLQFLRPRREIRSFNVKIIRYVLNSITSHVFKTAQSFFYQIYLDFWFKKTHNWLNKLEMHVKSSKLGAFVR